MSRQSTRGRPHCSSSSQGSASYQGISGATSPIYHLPQEPFHANDFGNSYRKKNRETYTDENRDYPNYYNVQQKNRNKDSIADTHSYQYFNDRDGKSYGNVDNTFSEDSSYYDYRGNYDGKLYGKQDKRYPPNAYPEDKRYANNVYSEYESDFPSDFPIAHSTGWKNNFPKDVRYQSGRNHNALKENHSILNQDGLKSGLRSGLDRVYPETPLTREINENLQIGTLRRDQSRISERSQSPGSIVSSAIVDGCGGHCVTFENICSYVLQIFFVMGILIGVSLCIAGTVLRKTKSRDLQVFVYIGAMSAMVCTVLLVVQCRVRRALSRRKRAVRLARTATIPLRPVHQPLIQQPADRPVIVPTTLQFRPQDESGAHCHLVL